MKKILLGLFIALATNATYAGSGEGNSGGGGMGGKGHAVEDRGDLGQAGGPQRMQAWVGRFERPGESGAALPAIASQLLTTEYLGDYQNFNCEFMQGLLSYGSRVMSYIRQIGFTVPNSAGQQIGFPNYDESQYFLKYLDPKNCIDLRGKANVDPRKYKQLVILLDDPIDQRKDLMAANFPPGQFPKEPALTGKILFFLNNWRKEKLLEDDLCRIDLKDDYQNSKKTGSREVVPVGDSDFARSCQFLTQLTAAAHEGASVNGVKEEQNDHYLFSSVVLELLSLNSKKPRARSLALIEAIRKHHLTWYKQSKRFELDATNLGNVAEKLNPGPSSNEMPDFISYTTGYSNAMNAAHQLQVEYQRFLEFMDLVVPKSLLIHDAYYAAVIIPAMRKNISEQEFTHTSPDYIEKFAFDDFFPDAERAKYNDLLRDLFRIRINSELAQARLIQQAVVLGGRFGKMIEVHDVKSHPIPNWDFKKFPGLTDDPRIPTP